jgi:hypothetical protein
MAFFGVKAKASCGIAALLLFFATGPGAHAAPRSSAGFVPGETIHYLLEYRSTIESQSAGPIYTPASAHRLDISLGARIRLRVLSVKADPKQGRLTRLRVTYETCDASVHSDAYDPGAEALQKGYRNLQGHSFEFTIDRQGRVSDVSGLDALAPDEGARNAMRQWLSSITLPLGLWNPGMKPGRKWSREVPFAGAPLAGLAWRTRSVYRDDEPCPAQPGAAKTAPRRTCAVISTQLKTVGGGRRGDATPLAYRRQGLTTSGRWAASGESLSYLSLSSGLVASSTATESDAIDLTITSTLSGSRLHYMAKETSSTQLALISDSIPSEGSSHD